MTKGLSALLMAAQCVSIVCPAERAAPGTAVAPIGLRFSSYDSACGDQVFSPIDEVQAKPEEQLKGVESKRWIKHSVSNRTEYALRCRVERWGLADLEGQQALVALRAQQRTVHLAHTHIQQSCRRWA